jgi:predicted transcriptional regulator of viral defense system
MPGQTYKTLFELATDRYGYVTIDDARNVGIDPHRLVVMADRGVLERIGHGVYHFPTMPASGLNQCMEAVLWPRPVQGVLSHETALDLHDLCDVNPAKVHITVPARHRTNRKVPELYVLHRRDLDAADVTLHEGIPIVTPYRAILDGIERRLGPRLLKQAIKTAQVRGLLRPNELADVRGQLRKPVPA